MISIKISLSALAITLATMPTANAQTTQPPGLAKVPAKTGVHGGAGIEDFAKANIDPNTLADWPKSRH
jgi:hypothetical protein